MAEDTVESLRAAGWAVAVHNDYRQDGEPRTFWLFTHPTGRWIKGEGRTDAEALAQCAALASPPSPGGREGEGVPSVPSTAEDGTPRLCPGCRALDGEHNLGPTCTVAAEAETEAVKAQHPTADVREGGQAPKPYYLIERNDRGRAEWLNWSTNPPTWTVDAHAATRYEWGIAAGRDMRAVLKRPDCAGLALSVTEHLDVPPAPLPAPQKSAGEVVREIVAWVDAAGFHGVAHQIEKRWGSASEPKGER